MITMSEMQVLFNLNEVIRAEVGAHDSPTGTCVCPAIAALAALKRHGLLNERGEALFDKVKEGV